MRTYKYFKNKFKRIDLYKAKVFEPAFLLEK